MYASAKPGRGLDGGDDGAGKSVTYNEGCVCPGDERVTDVGDGHDVVVLGMGARERHVAPTCRCLRRDRKRLAGLIIEHAGSDDFLFRRIKQGHVDDSMGRPGTRS